MTVSRFIPSLLLATSAFAQPALKFEVATIKPAPPDAALNRVVQVDPSRISFQMTLRNLVYYAYGNGLSTALRVSGGPDWIAKTVYDVQGLAPGSATPRQFRAMLRTLLAERFALKTHTETQTIDVFAMTPARADGKLGPKVVVWDGTCPGGATPREDDPKMPRCPSPFRSDGIFLEGATMFAAAEMLSVQRQALGRVVEDRTGLTGRYKMELEFQLAPLDPAGPSLFTAVREQWGLKLEPAKGSLEVVVIDSAQPPTEN
ncbi:MAG: TIGR03435 family protein [Acidobacteriia bacterium]|nr:TIGR03435 family protein [Terriglobia bacterium]